MEMKKKNGLIKGLDLLIGVLCVCLVGATAFAIHMFREDYSFHYDEDSFFYRMEEENFGQMVEMYYSNEMAGVDMDGELSEYARIAEYFEAASWHRVYKEAGDEEKANFYWNRMDSALAGMGELVFVGEKISGRLGIGE